MFQTISIESRLRSGSRKIVFFVFVLCICVHIAGQTAATPAEDTNMFEMFLRYQRAMAQPVTDEKTATSTDGRRQEEAAATVAGAFRMKPADFILIAPVYDRLKIQLDKLDDEGRSYVASARQRGRRPDMSVLTGFERRRSVLVRAAMSELKASLSAPGWNSLCEYINKDLAPQVRSVRVR